ncbi:hypothetical protein BBO99_00002788 [Phytophthora kernoviae]|uniref:Myosin motor domain-containing protein n=2 Tax=Phytophthora kernoviae TaxID=325452 RepID=A0A3R7HL48_9STRA|nr:hypothetical protein G195_003698 [Phytophthora kernoviae 00238/432]KAG2528297.1 hypothetical protein JM16_001326 [Phytophthora kernoviae]KAG2529512.1 hypothetical protein JM18_002764 [Phytophthora kernoviae]RLN02056.1 hypothetical protein BBI17_003562 [Phytophthora kernoviae]RLN82629.1 hypothetical protein BBO99_00002788 [Phytophthora kernoviae]
MPPSNNESVGRSDEEAAWLPVYVEEVNEQKGLVTVRIQSARKDQNNDEGSCDHDDTDRSGERRVVAMDVGFPQQNAQLSRCPEGLDNMIELNHLHEAAILRNLKKRFRSRMPYTYTGDICLAVNPYQWLDELYKPGLHKQYLRASKRQDLPPHVYAVSVAAFRHMCENGSNQSILVSGESGAGKTETTKILMDNLATIAPVPSSGGSEQEDSITTRIIKVNPLLESFGNAKTTRNDNSSRFGKFTQLQFNKNNALCGAQCKTYLLEKTRVISHERGERNYHIFYQLLHGTSAEERDALGLGDECPSFVYLQEKEPQQDTRSGRKPNKAAPPALKSEAAINAEKSKDQALFAKTKQALTLLGLNSQQQNDLFQVLSGVLHLGEAEFCAQPDNDEACDLVKDSAVYSSTLLGLNPETMGKALCHRTMKAAGEVYLVPLTVEQAQSGRDALAKAIYACVFDWLVAGINASLGAAVRHTAHTIGVLDIFGFESFEHNSFEQLCINYANEKLQHKFTQDVFKAVQEEYEREKITWAHIAYADNSDTLALIEGRMGVLALLNEEIVRPRGNEEGFVSKLAGAYRKEKKLIDFPRISKTEFAIHHYAGTVKYEAMGFLEKHKDALLSNLSDLMCGSHEPFAQMLFMAKAEAEAAAAASLKRSTSGGSGRKVGGRAGAGGAGADKTVGMQFKQSLNSLMANINETNVNYIRCIKPNSTKSATQLENKMVANQLRCAGVIEAICIARAGYPNRLLHAEFAEQFDIFLSKVEQKRQQEDGEKFGAAHCRVLVKQFKLEMPEEYQMGTTKIYLQKGVLEKLEHAKAQKLFAYVALIQAQWRGMRARCRYYEMRDALVVIQYRAKVFVARLRFLRAMLAIGTIQRVWRGHVGRCEYRAVLREARALRIQRVWRGHVDRKIYFEALCEHRATQIQRMWRGHLGRQIFFAALCQTCALRIQCFVRQYLARMELAKRRVAYLSMLEDQERKRLELEAERARHRKLEEQERERQRKLEEERERQHKLEEEHQLRILQEESAMLIQKNVRLYIARCLFDDLVQKSKEEECQLQEDSAALIQKQVRGYFARCLFAEMQQEAEEEKHRREEEEEERERIRLQREYDEREAKRLAAEEAAREKKRQTEERRRLALLARQRREKAVVVMQRITRGHLVRIKFAGQIKEALARKEEEGAATRLQSIHRGRLARQQFSKFQVEKAEQDEEITRVREENAKLKRQLAELLTTNQELESVVAEWRCDRDVLKASNNLREIELTQKLNAQRKELEVARGEYSTLCDTLEKSGSSRSTEPEELNSSESSGDEEAASLDDRPSLLSTSQSYFDGDRPSADIAQLLGPGTRKSRLTSAMQQRKQKASAAMQQRREQAANSMHNGATTITRAKNWVSLGRKTKKQGPTTPIDPIE